MSEEYVVQFDSHGDAHEASIDLECFARALKPYLRLPDAFQKLEKKHIEVPSHLPEDCMPECKYWMPTPSPEKCEHEIYHALYGEIYCPSCHDCLKGYCKHKPKDAVEEKIEMIVWENGGLGETDKMLEVKLRDLVRLVRETK